MIMIVCILRVGSAEAERSFAAFRRVKTFLRNNMGGERPLMNVHSDIHIDLNELVKRFFHCNRRLMYTDSLQL